MAFDIKKIFGRGGNEEYVEIDIDSVKPRESKVIIKPFILHAFEDIEGILNSLRDGYTIAVIDIKPLKSKDIIELKRAVSKIKKTVEALEGTIAGFGEHTIIATPSFAQIHKPTEKKMKEKADFIGLGDF